MIDFRSVGHVVGWSLLGLSGLMLAPLAVDLADRDANHQAFAVSAILVGALGSALALAARSRWRADLSLREGFLLTTGVWMVFPAAAALPMMLGAPGLGFTDAYFEAMSALTTTGSTVIAGLDHQPRGLLLWRGLLQWLGGIGIVLMAIILLPVLNIGGMKLLRTADFNTLAKIMPRAREIAVSIGSVYAGLTAACTAAYAAGGMSGFDAAVHAMTTLSSGGMGNYDASFAGFGPAAQYAGTVFMLASALSFVRFVQLARGAPGALLGDPQIRAFLGIYLAFVAALVAARLEAGAPLAEATLREVLFNVASVISSTGFASTDYGLWGGLADTLVFCIMMIGGCSGSTAGGVKVFRYQLLAAAVSLEVRRLHSPNVVEVVRYLGRRVQPDVRDSVMAFFLFWFLTLGIVAVLLVLAGEAPVTALSGAATALANVGPGLGPEIGPAGNFAGLSELAKWILAAAMLVGRLELLAVFVLFTGAFWRG